MEEPVPVWRERRGRLSAYRGPAQPPVQPGPGSCRGRCARRTRSRALGGTELHPERHRAGHAQTRARGPRLWLPARARPRSRLLEVFAFAFLPMSLRKMKVVVSRTGAAAVPGEGRRMRRRPAWSAGPGAPAQGEVAAHPGPPGSPEDGQQRNKKMDSLAAGELNASHQPWVPEFVAHWRKTHQELSAPCCAHPSSSLTGCAPDPGAWCMHKLGTWSMVLTTMPGCVLEGKPSSSSEGVPFSCVGICV
nr:uncharacterized protein LOC102122672 isoform X3 [Macaca fascicularis]